VRCSFASLTTRVGIEETPPVCVPTSGNKHPSRSLNKAWDISSSPHTFSLSGNRVRHAERENAMLESSK
jgi:hypothetical protein